jgi:nitrogen fixation NifU-like protein
MPETPLKRAAQRRREDGGRYRFTDPPDAIELAVAHRRREQDASSMGRYSDILMGHFMAPRNSGCMTEPDRIGLCGQPGDGPFMLLFLRLRDGRILDAMFKTFGCGPTIASGSMLTEMIKGRSVSECLTLTPENVADALGGVPPDKAYGPALAIGALRAALLESAAGAETIHSGSQEPESK